MNMLNKVILKELPEVLKEKDLQVLDKRWFEYREFSFGLATLLFFWQYLAVYRDFYAKLVDRGEALSAVPDFINRDFSLDDLNKVYLYRSRQAADSIGCKYRFYIATAFERVYKNGWHYFPKFMHLATNEVLADVTAAWEETKRYSLPLVGRRLASPSREAYHAYLLEQVSLRPESVRKGMIERLVRAGHLPENCA